MEKHKCKLCFKSFSNGRALGGHMRSHMLNLPIPPKPIDPSPPQLVLDTESDSSSDEGAGVAAAEAEGEKGLLTYGLRENPKKSFRLADPEFSFAVAAAVTAVDATSSVVLQDRESETESSKNHPTHRRRSKRSRPKPPASTHHHWQQHEDAAASEAKPKSGRPSQAESSWAMEPEPVSSISDTTTEEDVAFCLMMLSRDKWSIKQNQGRERERGRGSEEDEDDEELGKFAEEEEEEEDTEDGFDSDDFKLCKYSKGKYRCETCKKVFNSYQALGGHRASHKKLKLCNASTNSTNYNSNYNHHNHNSAPNKPSSTNGDGDQVVMMRTHECPVCFRVFSSGQALGGHKRSHLLHQNHKSPPIPPTTAKNFGSGSGRCGDNLSLIDLNLPAPTEDDGEFEVSAVSDAGFVNSIKR